MKKIISAVLITVLLLTGLFGCGKKDSLTVPDKGTDSGKVTEETVSDKGQKKNQNKTGKKTQETDGNLVRDRWADSGTLQVDGEYSLEASYDYRVPELTDDTEGAAAINQYLADDYEEMHNRIQKGKETGSISVDDYENDMNRYHTGYDCYQNDGIVSLVVYSKPNEHEHLTSYTVYNYDVHTGKELSNTELLEKKGASIEQYVEDIRRAAAYASDQDIKGFMEHEMPLGEGESFMPEDNVMQMYVSMMRERARTIHENNINESLPIFVDEEGELKSYVTVYDMGQYGWRTEILSDVSWKNPGIRVSYEDMLDVESKEDGIYFTVYETDRSQMLFEGTPIEFGREYRINGTYKNYTDAAFSWVGNGMQPYIFLLSDDGMISYVDVWTGLVSGYICAAEPLMGFVDVEAFEAPPEMEMGVMAKTKNGRKVDIDGVFYLVVSQAYYDFEMNMLNLNMGEGYGTTVIYADEDDRVSDEFIGFKSNEEYGSYRFVWESREKFGKEAEITRQGHIGFNGMNENGVVYAFSFFMEEQEDFVWGAMAMNVLVSGNQAPGYPDTAVCMSLGGCDIFESNGEYVVLFDKWD